MMKFSSLFLWYYIVNNNGKVIKMKDYYLLVGLNSKEIKILGVNQNNDGLIEVAIESKKNKVRCPICKIGRASCRERV